MPTPTNTATTTNDTSELSDADLNRAITKARGYERHVSIGDNGHKYVTIVCDNDDYRSPSVCLATCQAITEEDLYPEWSSSWHAAFGDLLTDLVAAGLKPHLDFDDGGDVEVCYYDVHFTGTTVRCPIDGDVLKAAARAISEAWKSAYDAGLLQPK